LTHDYHAASSLAEALELAARYGEDAHLMAGGTALVLLMKQGLIRPAHVIGLRGIRELRGIRRDLDGAVDSPGASFDSPEGTRRENQGTLRIGAMATHREVERSPEVRAHCAALAETLGRVATIRIRNQATVGGNLAHADPAQDPPPMLMALGAEVLIGSRDRVRTASLDEFFTDAFTTVLEPGEILREIRVPALPPDARAAYLKFLPRTADDYATVSVAAVATDGHVRVALGGVGSTPIRARAVERAVADGASIDDAAALVRDEIEPLDDARGSAAYKREMARVWTARALRQVLL